jgi:uncharacterized protein YecT (DUF1311 family)
MQRTLYALAILAAGAPLPAMSDIWDDCNDGPNIAMTQCIWDRYEVADKELNAVWKDVMATFDKADYLPPEKATEWKARLLAAQRAWITFKDEDCRGAVAFEWYGGSGESAAIGACLYTHTKARADDLRGRYLGR